MAIRSRSGAYHQGHHLPNVVKSSEGGALCGSRLAEGVDMKRDGRLPIRSCHSTKPKSSSAEQSERTRGAPSHTLREASRGTRSEEPRPGHRRDFIEAIRLDPTFAPSPRCGEGSSLESGESTDKALADYNELIRLDPGKLLRAAAIAGSPGMISSSTTRRSPTIPRPSGSIPDGRARISIAA